MDSKNSKKSSKEYEKVVHFRDPIDFKGFFKKRGFVVGAVLVIAVFFLVQNCTYSVKEQEQAIVTMFGNVVRTDTAGLYFKIPFLQQVHMVDMTTHGFGIGYVIENGQNITVEDEGVMITSDFNFIDIDFYVEYKVSDPIAAYFNSEDPYAVMKNIALANIRNTVVKYTVDDVMTTAKGKIQSEIKDNLVLHGKKGHDGKKAKGHLYQKEAKKRSAERSLALLRSGRGKNPETVGKIHERQKA